MSLLDKPLWRRKLLLQQILKDKTGVIEIADCAKASTKEEIHAFLVRILEERWAQSYAIEVVNAVTDENFGVQGRRSCREASVVAVPPWRPRGHVDQSEAGFVLLLPGTFYSQD